MKASQVALLFIIFFLALIIKTDISVGKLKSVENEKAELTASLESATSDAINRLESSGTYGTNAINRERIISSFFTSFYSAMGIISDNYKKSEIEMYITVILLCDSDGYYIYYYDDYKNADGLTESKRCWSEKMPYCYEDENFYYRFTLTDMVYLYDKNGLFGTPFKVYFMDYHEIQTEDVYEAFRMQHNDSILLDDEVFELAKKGAIVNKLEDVIAYYTSKHNLITRSNGITYNFSFPPDKKDDWANYMEDINLMVVFQGYPYGAERDYTFNKIVSAGANIIKKSAYYIEQKSWYYLAHRAGCEEIKDNLNILEENFYSLDECSKMGAYCHECIENGARVPDLRN